MTDDETTPDDHPDEDVPQGEPDPVPIEEEKAPEFPGGVTEGEAGPDAQGLRREDTQEDGADQEPTEAAGDTSAEQE